MNRRQVPNEVRHEVEKTLRAGFPHSEIKWRDADSKNYLLTVDRAIHDPLAEEVSSEEPVSGLMWGIERAIESVVQRRKVQENV